MTRSINSTSNYVDARVVDHPRDYQIDGRTIVVNTGVTPVVLGEPPLSALPAFSSTVLVDSTIHRGDRVLLLRVLDEAGMRGIVDEPGWHPLADLLTGFPRETPLYRGPREHIGTAEFDPATVLMADRAAGPRGFEVWVNLWFAPAGTDCGIHHIHEFIEIHSQIHGYGRMQKFRANDHTTIYEDQLMSPGHTPPVPFCGIRLDGGFTYPWHQYRADTDCVWLAVEYHAV